MKNYTFQSGFTRPELLGIIIILFSIVALALFNFQEAQIKARDEQRKASSRSIVNALEAYHKDFGSFPRSQQGMILACGSPDNLTACRWGEDKFVDLRDTNYPPYLNPIPLDPRQGQGHSFYYLSIGSEFQIFASLERRVDPEWSGYINSLDLPCGEKRCNYGITLSRKPVTKLLQLE